MYRPTSYVASEDSNFHHLVLDVAWFGVANAATTRFLTVFAIRLGASPGLLGLLAGLPSLVVLFSSLLGVTWRNRYPNATQAIMLPTFFFRFIFLLPAFTPFLPKEWQPIWLVLALVVPALPQGISSVIFIVMMRETVRQERMTSLFSRRSFALNSVLAVSVLAYGFWLERTPFPINYQSMFVVAFLGALMSFWQLTKIQPLENNPQARILPAALLTEAVPQKSLRSALLPSLSPWKTAKFRKVAITSLVCIGTFQSIVALTPLWLIDHLGAKEGFMAIFGLVELGAGATFAIYAPRMVSRLGSGWSISLGMVGTGLGTLIIVSAPNMWFTLIAAVLMGGSWAFVADVGLWDLFSRNTPPDDAAYSQAYFQVMSLGAFLGPVLVTNLIDVGFSLGVVMVLGACLRFMAAAVALWENKPRPVPAVQL